MIPNYEGFLGNMMQKAKTAIANKAQKGIKIGKYRVGVGYDSSKVRKYKVGRPA